MHAAPFTDDALYHEQFTKAAFWTQPDFFGVDMNPLREDALTFYYQQPVVGPVRMARASLARTLGTHAARP